MVMVLRYVRITNGRVEIHENPVFLFDAVKAISDLRGKSQTDDENRLSGVNIAELFKVKYDELDMSKYASQVLDGASSLSSVRAGAVAQFKNSVAPLARPTYFHRMMHFFKLCASAAVSDKLARNCMDKVRELATFFYSSAKRHQLLDCQYTK